MPIRHTKFTLPIIVFAIVTAVAHICVLPGHGHAAPFLTDGHGHDAPVPGHHDEPGDSSHIESCEALRSASSMPLPPLLVALPVAVAAAEIVLRVVDRPVEAVPPRASPPLYLVHRALLI
jgi:hypothetical protein